MTDTPKFDSFWRSQKSRFWVDLPPGKVEKFEFLSTVLPMSGGTQTVPEGKYTETVYNLIKDQKYADAIQILSIELQSFPRSRAALSLLGHCYYMLQDYGNAVAMYEMLVTFYGEVEEYKVYYAQSLYKAGMYAEATRAALRVESEQYGQRMMMLQAATKYEQDDLVGCKAQCDRCLTDDPDVVVAQACIAFKEKKYEEANKNFTEAMNTLGYQPDIAYNIALCHYQLKQYGPALKHIAEIIERGVREHPELSVGSSADGIDVRSVGNSQVLRETALVEAFNLKAAIEYNMKNIDQAKEALIDMPPRSEAEVDPVTLHNQALMNMDDDPTTGFRKLNFLLRNPPFPPPTFGNLLLLYCKFYHYDLAADVSVTLFLLLAWWVDRWGVGGWCVVGGRARAAAATKYRSACTDTNTIVYFCFVGIG